VLPKVAWKPLIAEVAALSASVPVPVVSVDCWVR
jgi:hypothetical protein